MIGKIDKDGFIVYKRSGKWLNMLCPYREKEKLCEDNCALFSEPVSGEFGTSLVLCTKTIHFDPGKFTDERNYTIGDNNGE